MSKTVSKGSAGPWVLAASTEECILGKKSGSKTGGKSEQPQQPPTKCPECSSLRIWKDGLRYVKSETGTTAVQRYICRSCGRRFSETDPAPPSPHRRKPSPERKKNADLFDSYLKPNTTDYKANGPTLPCQVCVAETQGAKNLVKVETRQEKPMREGTAQTADVKGKIIEFLWHLKKQGLSEKTANLRCWFLEKFLERGGDLSDPESIKAVIRKWDTWENSTKKLAVQAYDSFLKTLRLAWEKPRYKEREKLPFIPLEKEIDALINGCGKLMGTFLQGLKDTGVDPGELIPITWTDINFQSKTVTINHPVKGHAARVLDISDTFIKRLKMLPKKENGRLFSKYQTMHGSFQEQRRRLAWKLGNPRLRKIAFTTFRHWKATMEYHKTHDIYHVKKLLGHKRLTSTEIYINLEQAVFKQENDKFHVKAVQTLDEACKLIEVGFEYVTDVDDYKVFRKRK